MTRPRYLTKSRFQLALECPTKLFYTGKSEYANQKLDDSFLLALAEGGYQVGELAKHYFAGGTMIESSDHQEALDETSRLLKNDDAVIYEAAVRHRNLFIRADILVKRGGRLELFEVKAKSCKTGSASEFRNKDGTLASGWRKYIYDVAFQKYVLLGAYPEMEIAAHLILAHTGMLCRTDGLNQKFKITKSEQGRKRISVRSTLCEEDLSDQILAKVNIDDLCDAIFAGRDGAVPHAMSFPERVAYYADHYARDLRIACVPSSICRDCEFRTADGDSAELKSGFRECWTEAYSLSDADFDGGTVLEIWDYRKKDALLRDGRVKLSDVREADVGPAPDDRAGLSKSERQWMQIVKKVSRDETAWFDRDNFCREMESWVYPLHMIDFETTRTALPFNGGRSPYEAIAFQFSHHVVGEDGTVEHRGEYLDTEIGKFPNYDFVRALKKELETDEGSVFRYSHHENTFLCQIMQQIEENGSLADGDELIAFIRSITCAPKKHSMPWCGERNMIDLWQIGKRHFYDPRTGGSNSIKYLLPAILNRSEYLKEKYSKPIYGAKGGIRSLNFQNWTWIGIDGGLVIDPYKRLPKMFADVDDRNLVLLTEDTELRDGGAAMTAYARMQFEEMTDYERSELTGALLKYCELDTMAMVMLFEGWREMARGSVVRPLPK